LIQLVRDWVISKVDHWLMWESEPSIQRNCGDDELRMKGQLNSLQPNVPILGRGLFPLPDEVAWKRGHLWEDNVMADTIS